MVRIYIDYSSSPEASKTHNCNKEKIHINFNFPMNNGLINTQHAKYAQSSMSLKG